MCDVHIVQYQQANPDDPTSPYHLDLTIYDGAGAQIGQVLNQDAPSGQGVDVDSALPYVLIVTAQNVDEEILFNYAGQAWDSNDQQQDQCSFGLYDGGLRYRTLKGVFSPFVFPFSPKTKGSDTDV